ncbi:MAG TPA: hypothetical protein VMB25_22310 [Bryobacteraceae bacterium]|nr:hypothetical protein [Bryobacteraceae bacterium]
MTPLQSVPPSAHTLRIPLQVIAAPAPYQAYVLPVRHFPIAPKDLAPLKWFWEQLVTNLVATQRLSSQVFLQLTQYQGGSQRFAKFGPSWMPALGLGVWPDRPPPTPWTREEFRRVIPGKEPLRPLADQVLQVNGDPAAARAEMLDIGSVLEFLTPENDKSLLDKAKKALLPGIKDPSYRVYSLYIPLLEGKSVAGARADQLANWLCGALVYLRESFEDKGILIVSRTPLQPILQKLGGRPESEHEWSIPYGQPGQ